MRRSCGTGTRQATYACQDVSSYDYTGAGYGAPESDSACTSSGAGAKPSATQANCTDYSRCWYTWVKPPVAQTPIALESNPLGRVGCGQVRSVYQPYCRRSDGTVLSANDYRFCASSSGYDVNPSNPDTLGYEKTAIQTSGCSTSDGA